MSKQSNQWNIGRTNRIHIFVIAFFLTLIGPLSARAQSTFTVSPSGGDDTAAIQAAFDAAVAAGPGSGVILQAGTYCVMAPIIVRGFDGYWMGAGRDQTIVETCGSPFPVPVLVQADPAYPADPLLPIRGPFTFIEVAGKPSTNLTILDLTLHLKGETNPYYRHGNTSGPITAFQPALYLLGDRPTVFDGSISTASLSLDQAAIVGSDDAVIFGQPRGVNVIDAIIIAGGTEHISFFPGDFSYRKREQIQVSLTATRSHFERMAEAIVPLYPVDSLMTIGGNQSVGNTFELVAGPAFGTSPSNSTIRFSGNSGSAERGIYIQSGNQALFGIDDGPQPGIPFPPLPSRVVVSDNNLDIPTLFFGGAGAIIGDWPVAVLGPGAKTLNVLIENNSYRGVDTGVAPAFFGVDLFVAKDAIVRNNRIAGTFLGAGINAGRSTLPALNLSILGNNLLGIQADVAPIWLQPLASDSLVVGGPNGGQVFDQGVGNLLTGVNNMNGNPPGPEIREMIEQLATFKGL